MTRVELQIEIFFQGRFVAMHRLNPSPVPYVIGSDKDAHVRVVGVKVAGVHACIEYANAEWSLTDMGSEHGTWIDKQPVLERKIAEETQVSIGLHTLRLRPVTISNDLFGDRVDNLSNGQPYHEIVVKKDGLVLDVHLVRWGEAVQMVVAKRSVRLTCPTHDQPVVSQFGAFTVHQQKVHSRSLEASTAEKVSHLLDRDTRRALAVVSGSTLLVFALMVFWPQAPDETTSVTDVKVMTNKFTQVILDGKQAKARKQAAEQARQSMQRTEVKVSGRVQATVPKSASLTNTKGPRASVQIDKQLQAAGLGRLIGKIAKRRAPAGVFVAGQGVAAGSRPSGMVSNSVSGTIADAGRAGVKGGTGLFKLGGASTSGRAGGETGYMGSAGLGGAGVGSGSVGVLEEESDVQGGLAREVIARVIAENIGHIRYCYERQLSANPELYGKVLVKFTIGAAGSVDAQSIGTSTLNNANVEGCILRRVSGWKFPKPAGGTSVLVSYPFLFKSTN